MTTIALSATILSKYVLLNRRTRINPYNRDVNILISVSESLGTKIPEKYYLYKTHGC